MKKSLVTLATAAVLGLGSTVASATPIFLDFTVAPSSVGTNSLANFTADKINGGYAESVYISPTFQVSAAAYVDFGAFFKNQGSTSVFGSGLGNSYALYGLFTSTAQVTSPTTFSGLVGSIQLYVDRLGDTVKTLTGGTNPGVAATAGTADDYLLAFSTTMKPYESQGTVGVATPAFDFIFENFTLTSVDADSTAAGNQSGAGFFVGPNPFHMVVEIDGNIVGLNTAPGVYNNVTGAANVTFNVPEPATLALMGLALAGAGAVSRRRKQA